MVQLPIHTETKNAIHAQVTSSLSSILRVCSKDNSGEFKKFLIELKFNNNSFLKSCSFNIQILENHNEMDHESYLSKIFPAESAVKVLKSL